MPPDVKLVLIRIVFVSTGISDRIGDLPVFRVATCERDPRIEIGCSRGNVSACSRA